MIQEDLHPIQLGMFRPVTQRGLHSLEPRPRLEPELEGGVGRLHPELLPAAAREREIHDGAVGPVPLPGELQAPSVAVLLRLQIDLSTVSDDNYFSPSTHPTISISPQTTKSQKSPITPHRASALVPPPSNRSAPHPDKTSILLQNQPRRTAWPPQSPFTLPR